MKPIDRINHFRTRLKTFALAATMFAGVGIESRADLVGHWLSGTEDLLNTGTTGSAHDGIAVNNPGGLAYSTDLPPGFTNPALRSLSFSNGAAVEIANSATSDGGGYLPTFDEGTSSQLTVAFWAKGFPGEWSPWLGKDGEGGGWQVRRIGSNSGAGFTLRGQPNDNGGDSPINVNNGNWHHYAAVWDASTTTRTLYVDGAFSHVIVTGDNSIDLAAARHLVLGARQNNPTGYSHYFTGNLFDVRIYNSALTEQNVVDLIPLGAPQGLVATPGSGRISLNWTAVPLATEYTVSITPTAGGTPVTAVVTEPFYVKDSLTNGVSYDFKVLATKSNGSSVYSSIVSATPTPSPAKDILTFDLDGVPENVVISGTDITVWVPASADVTGLIAYYTISPFAAEDSTYPSGAGEYRDFTTPKTYTITAENLTTKTYTVTVIHADPIVYTFDDGLQGWTQLKPVPGTLPLWQDWNTGGLGTPEGPGPVSDDAPHTRLGRSPDFYLDFSGPLTFQLAGGSGGANTPGAGPSAVPKYAVQGGGFAGVALRDVADNTYVLYKRRSGNDGPYQTGSFTAAELAPYVIPNRRYTLDFIDANRGGWGWTRLDNVSIPGDLAPVITLAPEAKITSFNFPNEATIDDLNGTITLPAVPFGTPVSALTTTFTLSDGATCDKVSGDAQNFTGPVTFTVTSAPANEAGPQVVKVYTASVTVKPNPALALVGHWVSGAENLADTSGYTPVANAHDGVAVGTNAGLLTYSSDVPPGFSGKSLDLSAGNVAVEVKNSATTDGVGYRNTFDDQIRSQVTIAFWAKGFPTTWAPWVSKGGEGAGAGVGWQVRRIDNTNNAGFTVRGLGNADGGGGNIDVNNTGWHHFAAIWDQSTGVRSLYVDGVLSHNIINIGDVMNLAADQHLALGGRQNGGAYEDSKYFAGKLFDVRIYKQALFASELPAIIAPPASAFTTWINTNYPALSDKTSTGDPDGDGVSNFDEFAFGLNPGSASSLRAIVAMPNAATGAFKYNRLNPAVSGLTYTVMVSTSLTGWVVDTEATAGQSVFATNGDVQTMAVTIGTAWRTEKKLFVRVIAQ